MYEVEVKVRADHERVRSRLTELGADPIGRVEQIDTYYDAPHRDFAETDEALRLRRESRRPVDGGESREREREGADAAVDPGADGRETRVTYKGPLIEAESKTRREFETAVGDGETMGSVLDALGFEPAATVEKDRERFELDGFTVSLDSVADLGTFLEIEREVDDESAVESVREDAREVLGDLGLDPDDQIRTSYLGLLLRSE